MERKIKKSYLFIIPLLLISLSLILLNGCEKSEPESSTPAVTNNEMAMEEMADMPTESITADNGQSVCPVMAGNPINTDIYVEYEGEKVYFCCASCKSTFSENPEKYIADLPQFNK